MHVHTLLSKRLAICIDMGSGFGRAPKHYPKLVAIHIYDVGCRISSRPPAQGREACSIAIAGAARASYQLR